MLRNLFGLAMVGFFLAACGDGADGSGGAGGSTSQGGGGNAGCSTAADCDAPASECQVAACNGGVCSVVSVPQGTPAKTQVAGDCKEVQCEAGATVTHSSDADVSDDGNDCTVDACSAGSPTAEPAAEGTACAQNGGHVCDGAGECVQCNVNADCTDPQAPLCTAMHTCIPIDCVNAIQDGNETDVDCGGLCDPCDTGKVCLVASDCYHGHCDAGTCAAPTCDDGVANGGDYLANNGETDVDCGGPCAAKCGPSKGCDIDGDCVGNECTGMNGTCVPNCSDQVVDNDETDVDCGGATCAPCSVGQLCGMADSNCVVGAYCDAGTCAAKKTPGAACGAANECLVGVCDMTDGVCCNMACGDTCQSCKLAGFEGTCKFVAQGQDPENECAGAQVCDGGNTCVKSNGDTCAANAECLSGNCIDGVCCNLGCGGVCQACDLAGSVGTCTNVSSGQDPADECANAACNGLGACQKAPGDTCNNGSQCASGFCTDGRCCDTACAGTCVACNLAGNLGTCTNIPGGTDPAGECGGANPNCNGNGMCGP